MQAARLHGYHEPFRLEQVPEPRPRGPHDVIVRVVAAGLCRTDLHIIEGMLEPFGVKLPYTPGHETAGYIEEVGSEVRSVRPGDAVIVNPNDTCGLCGPCRVGHDTFCESTRMPGFTVDGGFADYMVTSERGVLRLPDGAAPVDMAPHADAGLAAYHAVKKAARSLGPADSVVVFGVGGLGHIAVQLLKLVTPARVIAVDRSPGALALAKELGADHCIEGDGTVVERVRDQSGGGVRAVIDFVGEGAVPQQALEMLRPGGTYYAVGYGGELTLPLSTVVANELNIVGNLVGTHAELSELVTLAADGRLKLRAKTYALADINKAVDDLRSGVVVGRAVLLP